jgi:lipopolysaccharide export LptBFGC system permease protein LptF
VFKTIQRYILFEVAKVFFVALLVLVGIFLLGGALQFVRRGISLSEFVRVIPFAAVATSAYTLPVALLVAVALGYGKLVDENEVVSMRAGGMSIVRATLPVYLFAFVLSFIIYFLSSEVIPTALYWRNMVAKPYTERLLSLAEGADETFELPGYHVFCRSYKGRRLSGVVVRKTDAERPLEILAPEGEIFFLARSNAILIELRNVTITFYGTGKRQSCDVLTCNRYTIEVPVVTSASARPKFFPSARLFKMLKAEKEEIQNISESLSRTGTAEEEREKLIQSSAEHGERANYIREELFSRFALSTFPFLFAMISLPLPLLIARYGRYASFLIAILSGFLGGFIPCLFFQSLMRRGFIGLWLAFAVSAAILVVPGILLTRRLLRL